MSNPKSLKGYLELLEDVKQRVHRAQVRAASAANAELIALYWDIGRMVVSRQAKEGWGAKVIDRLSADLREAFPGRQGFSARNLKYMRAFAVAWPKAPLFARPVARAAHSGRRSAAPLKVPPTHSSIVQAALAQLPWYHHIALLDKLQSSAARLWYAAKAVEHGWSRNILALQIDSGLRERQGGAATNFEKTLGAPHSGLAQAIVKDPYVFDFLGVSERANERVVEEALLVNVEKFLLELGVGFALIGRQIHLEVGGRDFYLDLLFYHWKLRCFVVIDLKAGEFTPEAAGKMNFYLSAVDDRYRQPADQPSMGLILCREKNRILAEYALRDIHKPIGISDYVTRLVDKLPKPLKGSIPSIREIESSLSMRGLTRAATSPSLKGRRKSARRPNTVR